MLVEREIHAEVGDRTFYRIDPDYARTTALRRASVEDNTKAMDPGRQVRHTYEVWA